ncbi:GspE/PulE family protein [Moritella viscosa]|uniref:Type II secretory pathway, ATPase n=1 Tax=Moritella viscosa TaxID=80854 RepID=A0A090IL49_9GAMM|nr:GspE/PulE family protein [Moritella viscosa]CED62122.1 type IV pilus, mannose-sensitive hemagglutinin E (MSHE) [Moritella viscosa]SGY92354.1 Type II secretory pathway, ATPase [Moritella viscosa]SGY96820.1 Type II secretory pathway, ATPase [Moritella viscosa]SGZ02603.1 Type II secretory pathway, ATPase [Moritella viscosa]SGZ03080.1 Type II secretory pathway, ATPase [Moritella viscosa]
MAQLKLKQRLGDLLVGENIISEAQLGLALKEQRSSGGKLGSTLINLDFITEEQLLSFLSRQLNIPFLDISALNIPQQTVLKLPEVHARRHRALVVKSEDNHLTVALSDPADLYAVEAISNLLSLYQLDFAIVRESQLLPAYDRLYRRTKDIEAFAGQLEDEHRPTQEFDIFRDVDDASNEATVVKFLNSVFEDAVQVGASDIHIEPDEKALRIRLRVDGVLQENILNEVAIVPALVLRLKLMAGLDISEKRLPQDGRFNLNVRNQSIDVRMSTMPVQYGESVVMRLLNQDAGVFQLESTGMPAELIKRLRSLIRRPHGMVLVTGPTGSGKTTTLYAALSELNEPGKKIITVEDPVEYRLPRISQVQVNPKIGLDFAHILRTCLRQDPDILLVGEMRDKETAEIGLRGALTGHMVLSTLHTNDAITCALRLMDMGAPGYLIGAALRAVVAQRLVRKLCSQCKSTHDLASSEQYCLEKIAKEPLSNAHFYRSVGCQSCNYTGYRGRIGVFELLELNDAMCDALRREAPDEFAVEARKTKYYRPLVLSALDFAKQGLTSIEEVLKLADELSLDDRSSEDDASQDEYNTEHVIVSDVLTSETFGANIAENIRELDKVDSGDIEKILRLAEVVRALERSGQ